jgi:hypothetical protein
MLSPSVRATLCHLPLRGRLWVTHKKVSLSEGDVGEADKGREKASP